MDEEEGGNTTMYVMLAVGAAAFAYYWFKYRPAHGQGNANDVSARAVSVANRWTGHDRATAWTAIMIALGYPNAHVDAAGHYLSA